MRVHELAGVLHGLCKLRVIRREAQGPVRLTHGEKFVSLLHAHLFKEALRQDEATGISNLADLQSVGHNRIEAGYESIIITSVITTDSLRIGFVDFSLALKISILR